MAHGGGGGGGKKKKQSLVRTCLTSTIAIIVFIYVGVLVVSAVITTFLGNRGPVTISTLPATTAPPATTPVAVIAPTQPPNSAIVPPQTGSSSTGGGTTLVASTSGGPAMGPIKVTADGPFYIVEQSDLVQNGVILSFADSLQLIADKLLTTPADLQALNQTALSNHNLIAGEVLRVPSIVTLPGAGNGGGNLPPTGRYASP